MTIESGKDASTFFRELLKMTSLWRRRSRQPSLPAGAAGARRNGLREVENAGTGPLHPQETCSLATSFSEFYGIVSQFSAGPVGPANIKASTTNFSGKLVKISVTFSMLSGSPFPQKSFQGPFLE